MTLALARYVFVVFTLASPFVSTNVVARSPSVHVMSIQHALPSTVAQNCGNVPFNISWSPDYVAPYGNLTFNVDYTFPHDFDGGHYNATAFFHGDTVPFVGYNDAFTCDKISKYFPCPAKKGVVFKYAHTIGHIHHCCNFPGDYDVIVSVTNRKNQLMICLKARVIIKN